MSSGSPKYLRFLIQLGLPYLNHTDFVKHSDSPSKTCIICMLKMLFKFFIKAVESIINETRQVCTVNQRARNFREIHEPHCL